VFDLDDLSFEWDEEKDRIDFTKHGIRFKTAAKVFLDPDLLVREDVEHPDESRYDVLGNIGKIIFVVCTFRRNNVIRLISARKSDAKGGSEVQVYRYGEDDFE